MRAAGRVPWPLDVARLDPKIYTLLQLAGVVLLAFPEPLTSTVGLVLLVVGLFIAAVDFASAS